MLAFIGGLFAGIFGIFPFSKKSEYILEFDKIEGTNTPKQESTQATVVAASTKAETQPQPANSDNLKEAKAELTAAKKEALSTTPQQATPQPAETNDTTSQKLEELVSFASRPLTPITTAKRRPGLSMKSFSDLTKGMNLPR
ncbi:MAG: hypothetical protein MGG11_05225 [Trichodesmium sp. MAG_R03]|nr:hypothetical protein [Trichodesmium sp. MAG_R03]MDE5069686.1 hypothetical protein [Trichodesmium sp. St4_bin8_1]